MIDYFVAAINEVHISLGTTVLRLLLGFVLGLCIGAERQVSRHDAGLRTFTLISVGSAGAVIISIWIPQMYPDFLNGDPGRIAAQVLTGVGFLGAGAIVHGKGGVQGLTTAACIWQTCIVGMAAGAGLYVGAILMTVMTLFVLITMEWIEKALHIDGENLVMTVSVEGPSINTELIKKTVEDTGAKLKVISVSSNVAENKATATFRLTLESRIKQSDILRVVTSQDKVSSVKITT